MQVENEIIDIDMEEERSEHWALCDTFIHFYSVALQTYKLNTLPFVH